MRLRLSRYPWSCVVAIVVLIILTYGAFYHVSSEQHSGSNDMASYYGERGGTAIAQEPTSDLIEEKEVQPNLTQLNSNTNVARDSLNSILKISQLMETSQTDGYRMYLKCSASVNNYHHVDMRWSGRGLQQSLWVRQAHVSKQDGYIERKLFFKPWLDMHAGEYTCNLNVKDDNSTVKKTFVVTGKYRGLINSRNTTQKFNASPSQPSKWFPNANLCEQDDLWQDYANFHDSVLSGKQTGKYLIYECINYEVCGGYGNRIHGISVLLTFAMLTRHVFLLQMTKPIDINAYLSPNAVKWNHTVPKGLKTLRINLHGQNNVDHNYKLFESALLHNNSEYDVIKVEINFGWFYYLVTMGDKMFNKLISTFNLKTQYDAIMLYGCAFNYLFKYQPEVIQAIDSLQTELGLETGKFVALHIRSYLYEGWVFNPLHLEFPFKLMFDCAITASKSLSHKLNLPKVPVFLATDHPSITAFAKENYNDLFVFSRAPLFHVDRTVYRGTEANSQYNSGMIGVLSDIEICSRAAVLIRSALSTLSEVMGAIHFLRPQYNLHPHYFYENSSLCEL